MMSAAKSRRTALLEALAWLEYRAEVCRQTEEEWAEKHGTDSRGCATERAARHELELAISAIAGIANTRRNDKALRQQVAEREAFVRERQALRAARKSLTPESQEKAGA